MTEFPESPALAQAMLEQSLQSHKMAPKAKTSMKAKPLSKGKCAKPLSKGKFAKKSMLKKTRGNKHPLKKTSSGSKTLRNGLAQHKGTLSVIQNMSRWMYPAFSAVVDLSTLVTRGVTPSLYMERFGGFGLARDVGMIAWQVAMVMAYMQQENHAAAKDALSRLLGADRFPRDDLLVVEMGCADGFCGRSWNHLAVRTSPRPLCPPDVICVGSFADAFFRKEGHYLYGAEVLDSPSLHPGGSIGGFITQKACSFLASSEGHTVPCFSSHPHHPPVVFSQVRSRNFSARSSSQPQWFSMLSQFLQ